MAGAERGAPHPPPAAPAAKLPVDLKQANIHTFKLQELTSHIVYRTSAIYFLLNLNSLSSYLTDYILVYKDAVLRIGNALQVKITETKNKVFIYLNEMCSVCNIP